MEQTSSMSKRSHKRTFKRCITIDLDTIFTTKCILSLHMHASQRKSWASTPMVGIHLIIRPVSNRVEIHLQIISCTIIDDKQHYA